MESPKNTTRKKLRIAPLAQCIRKTANTSSLGRALMPDSKGFDPAKVAPDLSAKFNAIIDKIRELDEADMAKHGKKFKHFLFTDIRESAHGAKAIASFLIAAGFELRMKHQEKFIKRGGVMVKTEGGDTVYVKKPAVPTGCDGFALLQSLPLWQNPLSVATKKEILKAFNARPDNVNGENLRILVLDSKFKEGIDLFDVKYVHLVEPAIATSDLKQAVGRATRFCGQKGLPFLPRRGWPLEIFVYDLQLPSRPPFSAALDDKGTVSVHDLMMEKSGLDLALLNLTKELTVLAIRSAVDYDLNFKINNFSLEVELAQPELIVEVAENHAIAAVHGMDEMTPERIEQCARRKSALFPFTVEQFKTAARALKIPYPKSAKRADLCKLLATHPALMAALKVVPATPTPAPVPPVSAIPAPDKKSLLADIDAIKSDDFQREIAKTYAKFKWQSPVIKNGCEAVGQAAQQGKPVSFTQTQDFVRHYLTPESPYKGLLAWHSVGTGKTCMAVAAATTMFEKAGYTILWVTRNALMSDIYKNLFGAVCSIPLAEEVEKGRAIPADLTKAKRMLSRQWMAPISYRTFQNALEGKNELGRALYRKNANDPLHKTFLIIDEIHKLQDGDLSASEAADFKTIQSYIHKSYEKSKDASVRPLLMTATPITDTPNELFEILNTLIPAKESRFMSFPEFRESFANEAGELSAKGVAYFRQRSRGLLSYLNREFDPTTFAQPHFQTISVPLRDPSVAPSAKELVDRCLKGGEIVGGGVAAHGVTLDSYLHEAFIEIDCEGDVERDLKKAADTIKDAEILLAAIGEIKRGKDPAMIAKREEKAELMKLLKESKRIFALTKKNAAARKRQCEEANRSAVEYMKKFAKDRTRRFKSCYKNEKADYQKRAIEKGQLRNLVKCFPGFKEPKVKAAFVTEKEFMAELEKRLPAE